MAKSAPRCKQRPHVTCAAGLRPGGAHRHHPRLSPPRAYIPGGGGERGGAERFHSWAHGGHGGGTSSRLDAPGGTSGATLSGHRVAPEESTPRAGAWSPEMPHSQWQVRGAKLLHRPSQLMPQQAWRWRGRGHDPPRLLSLPLLGDGGLKHVSAPTRKGTGDFHPHQPLMWLYDPRKSHWGTICGVLRVTY